MHKLCAAWTPTPAVGPQIYAGGLRGPASEPEQVEQLVAMGFDRHRAAAAMRRYRNMDVALAILLQQEEAAQAAQGEQAAGQQGEQQAAAGQGGQGQEGQQAAAVPAQAQQATDGARPVQEAQGGAGAAMVQTPVAAAGGPEAAAHGEGHAHDGDEEGNEHEHDEEQDEDDDDDDEEEEEEEEEDDEEEYEEDQEEDMTGASSGKLLWRLPGIRLPGPDRHGYCLIPHADCSADLLLLTAAMPQGTAMTRCA